MREFLDRNARDIVFPIGGALVYAAALAAMYIDLFA